MEGGWSHPQKSRLGPARHYPVCTGKARRSEITASSVCAGRGGRCGGVCVCVFAACLPRRNILVGGSTEELESKNCWRRFGIRRCRSSLRAERG